MEEKYLEKGFLDVYIYICIYMCVCVMVIVRMFGSDRSE